MSKLATLRAQANNLKQALADQGITLTKAQALEAIAKQYGQPNWDTAAGILNKKPSPKKTYSLADMPLRPSEIRVETNSPRAITYDVDFYEEEGIALLNDWKALEAHIAQYYSDGLDSGAIGLHGDGQDARFTFRQLLDIRYADIGMGFWKLADGITTLTFICDGEWRPDASAESSELALTVPDVVKSIKGTGLVVLRSGDGGDYDKYVLVPPFLDKTTICDKITAEICRLRALDRDNQDNPEYPEYTTETLAAFVSALGALWVDDEVVAEEIWD